MADGGTARRLTQAQRADKHEYYEASVQNVEADGDFITSTFRELRRRRAVSFREDFCGTAGLACHWVGRGRGLQATGVDIEPSVLEWGKQRHVAKLTPAQRRRLKLIQANVLDVETPPVDVVGAFNFSYWVFKDRKLLRRYFRRVRDSLVDDGVFFLDAFGGYEAYQEMQETSEFDGFEYVWDQDSYHPVTGDYVCHIHFRFPDGSRLNKAFTYHWRLWSLPELREILLEAGFREVVVYWEGTTEDGEGNGEFLPENAGEADAGWVAYLVALK